MSKVYCYPSLIRVVSNGEEEEFCNPKFYITRTFLLNKKSESWERADELVKRFSDSVITQVIIESDEENIKKTFNIGDTIYCYGLDCPTIITCFRLEENAFFNDEIKIDVKVPTLDQTMTTPAIFVVLDDIHLRLATAFNQMKEELSS